MTRVRSQNATRALVAVKRQNIRAERLVKEALVEPATHCVRLIRKRHRSDGIAQSLRNLLRGSPCRIHIGLDLDHGDWTLRQRSIGVEDGVTTILPTLVDQPVTRRSSIFDKAVAIAVAIPINPFERRLDMRPESPNCLEIAGAFKIGACQHDKKWRRIDAAVVAAERHLAQAGHFAVTRFMKDFAWLGVGAGVDGGGLSGRKVRQHPARDCGIEPQRFQGRDDAVAPEDRTVPGDAGVGIGPLWQMGHQNIEIGDAAVDRFIEDLIGGLNGRGA
jgi:hypothetical protein